MLRSIRELITKNWILFLGVQLAVIIQVCTDIGVPLLLQQLNQKLQIADFNWIDIYVGGMIGLIVVGLIAGTISWILAAKIVANYSAEVRMRLYVKTHDFTFTDLNRFSTGSLIRRLTENLQVLVNWLGMMSRIVSRSLLMLVGGVVATIVILLLPTNSSLNVQTKANNEWIIILILIFFIAFTLGFIWFVSVLSRRKFDRVQPINDEYVNIVQESILGIRFLKAYNLETMKFHQITNISERMRAGTMSGYYIEYLIGPILNLSMSLVTLVVIWIGSNFLQISQIISLVQTLTYTVIGAMIASFVLSELGKASSSAKRVYEVIDCQPAMAKVIKPNQQLKKSLRLKFDQVSFKYFENSEEVLSNISFELNEGQTLGIIGKTGSGKSTLVSLIPRLYDVTKGKITLNNDDIKTIDTVKLKNAIAFVPQKNNLFAGTVAFNLQFAKATATNQEMWQSLDMACAKDFILKKENQLEANVEQRGTNFSGGQKQRLCIARALLKQSPILVLDDSTSALDGKTEKQLLANLHHNMPHQTKIIVSQKIASVIHAHQIVVLEKGKIVGLGNHNHLMASCEIYQEIYHSQMGN